MSVRKRGTIIQVPITTSALAYTAGNQVGAITKIPSAVLDSGGVARLNSLVVQDLAKQKILMEVWIFSDLPTDNGDKTALTLTAADIQDKLIATVTIPAADFSDSANASIATEKNLGIILKAKNSTVNGTSKKDLYLVVVTRGTPTYGAGVKLQINLGLEQF